MAQRFCKIHVSEEIPCQRRYSRQLTSPTWVALFRIPPPQSQPIISGAEGSSVYAPDCAEANPSSGVERVGDVHRQFGPSTLQDIVNKGCGIKKLRGVVQIKDVGRPQHPTSHDFLHIRNRREVVKCGRLVFVPLSPHLKDGLVKAILQLIQVIRRGFRKQCFQMYKPERRTNKRSRSAPKADDVSVVVPHLRGRAIWVRR